MKGRSRSQHGCGFFGFQNTLPGTGANCGGVCSIVFPKIAQHAYEYEQAADKQRVLHKMCGGRQTTTGKKLLLAKVVALQ